MKQVVNGNRHRQVAGNSKTLSSSLAVRVALAKKKIKKEVWAQLNGVREEDARLWLAIVFQAMDDLHIGCMGEVGRSMAKVYLYASEIKELEVMDIDTGWVQRILKDLQILDASNPAPYIEACRVIQQASGKAWSREQSSGLMRFIPVCEGVPVQAVNDAINKRQAA